MKLARWCEKTWETWTQRFALTEPHEDFTPNPNDTMPWLTRFNLQVLHISDPPAFFIFSPSFPSPLHCFNGVNSARLLLPLIPQRNTVPHDPPPSLLKVKECSSLHHRILLTLRIISHLPYPSVCCGSIQVLHLFIPSCTCPLFNTNFPHYLW